MIDAYLDELARHLHVGRSRRARIVEEVRDHLNDASERFAGEGLSRAEAEQKAVARFGPARDVAARFGAEAATSAVRTTPFALGAAGLAVTVGFLGAGLSQPRPLGRIGVHGELAVPFQVAAVAYQVALVAGVLLALRVAARWRATAMPADDRRVLRRTAAVLAAALGVTAAGWTVALAVYSHLAGAEARASLAAGVVVMVAGAIGAACVAVHVRHVDLDDVPDADRARAAGLFGAGEQALGWVNRHPRLACGAVAVVAAAGAMSHAETTFRMALVWGALEAACVVAGFLLLGPILGLRDPRSRGATIA